MGPVGSKEEEGEEPPVLSGPTAEEELEALDPVLEVVVPGSAVPPVLMGPSDKVDEVELAKGG